jgi:polysaccharide deacetylase 2 family uncharacterized protein YibQ
MLHLPMENLTAARLGPGALIRGQDRAELLRVLQLAIADIPHVAGINNHMGSLLTQDEVPMSWLMAELFRRNLYFVDSMTTPLSVAHRMARRANLLEARRDVFLDHDLDVGAIDRAFREMVRIARQHGTAIAIGHPHSQTLAYLEQVLPRLAGAGITLLPASAVAAHRTVARRVPGLQVRTAAGGDGPWPAPR